MHERALHEEEKNNFVVTSPQSVIFTLSCCASRVTLLRSIFLFSFSLECTDNIFTHFSPVAGNAGKKQYIYISFYNLRTMKIYINSF